MSGSELCIATPLGTVRCQQVRLTLKGELELANGPTVLTVE